MHRPPAGRRGRGCRRPHRRTRPAARAPVGRPPSAGSARSSGVRRNRLRSKDLADHRSLAGGAGRRGGARPRDSRSRAPRVAKSETELVVSISVQLVGKVMGFRTCLDIAGDRAHGVAALPAAGRGQPRGSRRLWQDRSRAGRSDRAHAARPAPGRRRDRVSLAFGAARYNRVSPDMGSPAALQYPAAQETLVNIRRSARPLALVTVAVCAQARTARNPIPTSRSPPGRARLRPARHPRRRLPDLSEPRRVGARTTTTSSPTRTTPRTTSSSTSPPEILVRSNFPRHAIAWTTQADIGRYVSETDEDYEDFGTALDGRLDITRNNRLTAGVEFARGHESRDDPEDDGRRVTDEPSVLRLWRQLGFHAGVQPAQFRPARHRSTGATTTSDGDDEDDRDRNLFGGRLRTGYFVSPRINAFLQGGFNRSSATPGQPRRSATINVYSAGVGAEIDFTGLLFGEFNVGWSLAGVRRVRRSTARTASTMAST